ncbi:alpha/beta hydrolase fold domain-containing protein [Candidatus Pristimantibacillus sp. PTI5]|uniref:alpha/beta hydrolase fold domain-containing protein n=1 Tax=Candidatus Pristimantibacillus sp. PTI5 TaxID=3400422 RepID=UPI003B027024
MASLSWIARKGYAVALAEYRPSEAAPFPAQIQDAKTAIRFLRKNAAEYKINPNQVAVWGDSSGGHTAVMAGLTWQEKELDTELFGEYSCQVNGIIDYYAPTDISQMNKAHSTMDHIGPQSPEGLLIGGLNVLENPEKAAPTICMNYVSEQVPIPPILIIHGNKDRLVPFEQSILLYNCLKENGKEAELYQIEGADHGGPAFWSHKTLEIVESFLQKCLP